MSDRGASTRPSGGLWRWSLLFLITWLSAGCANTTFPERSSAPSVSMPGAFPPQGVMEHGNYSQFLAENRVLLDRCQGDAGCEVALFNLGFVYAYAQSPYRDPTRAVQYFGELLKRYPHSPWAFQARAWMGMLTENLRLQETRRRLQAELHTLRDQLNRSREIDIRLEKKERELSR